MEKISVILPIYNSFDYLRVCIDSIVMQTYQNLEIIIIDDGSTDGSGEICDEYASRDERIKLIRQVNSGVPTARNRGLDAATGDWISFVDSDDYLEITAYDDLIVKLREKPADAIMFCHNTIGKDSGSKVNGKKSIFLEDKNQIEDLQLSSMAAGYKKYGPYIDTGYLWNKLYSRKIIEENRIRLPSMAYGADDRVFNAIFFGYAHSLMYIDCRLYNYRVISSSISHGFVKNRLEWDEALYEALLNARQRENIHVSCRFMEAWNACVVNTFSIADRRFFFHPDNDLSVREQIKCLKTSLLREPYKTAFKISKFKYLSRKGRIIKLCSLKRAECMFALYHIKSFLENFC